MNEHRFIAVVLTFTGAGGGAIAAHLCGVTSWLDARLYIGCGAALGLIAAAAIDRYLGERE